MTAGVTHLVESGPLLLALPIAAAAGAITFLSPCTLPRVPGYLSYVTGMSGTDAQQAEASPDAIRRARSRTLAGTALFVIGFSAVFATDGLLFGSLGAVLRSHTAVLTQILGGLTILLGLLFAGVFDRFPIAGRIARPSVRPRAGLAGAPVLGVMFGLSWTPCIGPTLTFVLTLSMTSGTAVRGAILTFAYCLGLGIPFLIVSLAFERSVAAFGFARRHARAFSLAGGAMLVAVGILEITGAWSSALL